jgi:hypothetical protein
MKRKMCKAQQGSPEAFDAVTRSENVANGRCFLSKLSKLRAQQGQHEIVDVA